MTGYNRIIMIGNLTRDPEIKAVGAQSVCKLTIASNKQYKNKQTGILSQEVCFIDIEVWGAQAESCSKYLQKGKPVLVEGRLKLDTWKDQEGSTKSKHSILSEKIIFLPSSQDAVQLGEESHGDEVSTPFAFSKQESVQVRPSMKEKPKKASNFVDNPPFLEDDLPF